MTTPAPGVKKPIAEVTPIRQRKYGWKSGPAELTWEEEKPSSYRFDREALGKLQEAKRQLETFELDQRSDQHDRKTKA